ncbi:MAG: hypothetical protein J6Y01_08815, partial [Spirochaetales bacterium]|nr:hypothetical protein [Spirochaetales bacterium]
TKMLTDIESHLDEQYRNRIFMKIKHISIFRKFVRVLRSTRQFFLKEWHLIYNDIEYKESCFKI